MKQKTFKYLVILSFLLTLTTTTSAAIPRQIAYQGILTDNTGNPLADGVQKVLFELYDDSTATAVKIWSDETQDVTTRQGYFAVILGSKTQLNVAFDKQYWMQTTVNAKPLSPRVPFTASAYALRADTADVAMSLVGLNDSLAKRSTAGHGHSVLLKQGKSETAVTVDTAGRVGIGTKSPNMKLDVNGGILGVSDIQFPNINLRLDCSTTGMGKLRFTRWDGGTLLNNAWIGHFFQPTLHEYMLGIALGTMPGTEKTGNGDSANIQLVIRANGNVGIGTTEPTTKLLVTAPRTSVPIAGILRIGTDDYSSQASNIMLSVAPGVVNFDAPGIVGGRFKLDSIGNIGIGTTTPQSKLHIATPGVDGQVDGLLKLQIQNKNASNTGSSIGFYTTTNQNAAIVSKTLNNSPDGCLEFQTRDYVSETVDSLLTRMTISPNGNVGIGTTTPKFPLTTNQGGTIATTILRLQNSYLDQGSYGIQLAGIDNGINGHNLHIQARNTLSGAFYDIAEFHNNGELSISGTISASNGAWSSSDRRFKLNIHPIDTALSLINSITGVRYDWDRKSFPERNFSDTRQIGLIAQDVEKVLPELVHTDSDGYKSLSYDKLTAVLVEAVKELKVENEKLKARVEALEKR